MPEVSRRLTEEQRALVNGVRDVCKRFGPEYWRPLDQKFEYPSKFIDALTESGYLAALIPEEYGGSGLGVLDASLILEEINRCGCTATACHAQMYTMGTVLRHGNAEQKARYLPKIATGELRLQAFGVTEPDAGSDTTAITTFARRVGDHYVVNGRKWLISRVMQSDLMLLLARTTPLDKVAKKTDGLSVFLIELKGLKGFEARPIQLMINHHTNSVFFDDVEIPASSLIGEEGKGFKYILDGLNVERTLVAAQAIGDARYFVDHAVKYAKERVVFGRPIGQNQGIQFPIAEAHVAIEAADLMRVNAAQLFDAREPCGREANMAKYLAAEAVWKAANVCMDTYGGPGFAVEFDIERKFRHARLYRMGPVAANLVLAYIAEHELDLPRSY